MHSPLVSVVIPAYNQASFLGETIQSVLDQTYQNLEVIVVNDASPDNTGQVVAQFDDPRVKYIVHNKNKGLPATRNTGMQASSGEIIALLDADDIFHPEKLKTHVDFLLKHPEIGGTYNGRFDFDFSATTIRRLWRPPLTANLVDFVKGFPFTPSDMVIRREWATRVDFFDERYVCGGEDTDFPCRLALADCQFASVDRALNYRRYHSGRGRKNLPGRLNDVKRALDTTFNDSRCPAEVLTLGETALVHHLLVLIFLAFNQEETALGHEFSRELVRIDSTLAKGRPSRLVKFLLAESVADENMDHAQVLQRIFKQLPPELAYLSEQYDWAVQRGYILRGLGNIMWGRQDRGEKYLIQGAELGAKVDEPLLRVLTAQLLNYEAEFGFEATQKLLYALSVELKKVGTQMDRRWLRGHYFINRAFRDYRNGQYQQVSSSVFQAISSDPTYLGNRGTLSILSRSFFHSSIQSLKALL